MRPRLEPSHLAAAAIVALGLIGSGWFAAQGMAKLRTQDRYVTVKGSAERDVEANLVVWPLSHAVGGNGLAEVQQQLDANTNSIREFFLSAGFPDSDIVVSPPRLEDRWVWAYGENRPPERFRYANTVTLRTTDVAKAQQVLRRSGELVARGILLSNTEGEAASGPDFSYTQLNAIKPELIAEATAEARKSAEQFAQDSGARIGGIRSANQGVITINNRDRGSPQVKTVRVVTTVEYFLR